MSFVQHVLAVDWGTTNRRVYEIRGDEVVRTERDDRGVTSVHDFPAEIAAIRARFGDLPILLAGMVGSSIGWQVAPYVPTPAGIEALAANAMPVADRIWIVPGVSVNQNGRGDVMRGEEVQLLGAVAAGLAPADALLVQPGTHCKWVRMTGGIITGFTTAMTGELFALVRSHGILSSQLGAQVTPDVAFREGVAEGTRRDLAASLFGVRAAKLLGLRDDADAASYVSGLLIGSDVAARLAETTHDTTYVLADASLGALYVAAIETQGRPTILVDSHAAFIAGITRIGALIA